MSSPSLTEPKVQTKRRFGPFVAVAILVVFLWVFFASYVSWQRIAKRSRGITIKGDLSLVHTTAYGYVEGFQLGERRADSDPGRLSDDELGALLNDHAASFGMTNGGREVFLDAAAKGYADSFLESQRSRPLVPTDDGRADGWRDGYMKQTMPSDMSLFVEANRKIYYHTSHHLGMSTMAYFRAYAENYTRSFAAGTISRILFSVQAETTDANSFGPKLQIMKPLEPLSKESPANHQYPITSSDR